MAITRREAVERAAAVLRLRGVPSPRREARWLLAHVLRRSLSELLVHPDDPVGPEGWRRFWSLVERRSRGEPLAYVTGVAEFMGRRFLVNRSVLIPRPETEVLVEVVAGHLRGWPAPLVADVGTGSGAVAVGLALAVPEAAVHAVDISRAALRVARRNVRRHCVSARVTLHWGDLCRPLAAAGLAGRLAAVAANPPYVASGELGVLDEEVRLHEPLVALVAGEDGLAVLRRLVREAPPLLAPRGLLAVEVGWGQARAVEELFVRAGLTGVRAWTDQCGVARVVVGCAGSGERKGADAGS